MCLLYTIYQKTRVTGSYAKRWDHFSWMSCIRKLISDYKNAFCSRFWKTKTLYIAMIDHLSQSSDPSCSRWPKTFSLKYWKIGNYFPFFPFPILLNVRSPPLNLKMSAVWPHRNFSSTDSESEGLNIKHDGWKSAFRQMASASRTP